jgi:hypothetical protein
MSAKMVEKWRHLANRNAAYGALADVSLTVMDGGAYDGRCRCASPSLSCNSGCSHQYHLSLSGDPCSSPGVASEGKTAQCLAFGDGYGGGPPT